MARLRGEVCRTTIHPSDVFHLRAPAQGDAFEFGVTVHVVWCVEGRESAKRLRARLGRLRWDTEERLLGAVRPICRKHPPYAPKEAEEAVVPAVHRVLDEVEYPLRDGGARPRPGRVLVNPAKDVRDIARTAWQRRQEMMHGHDLALELRKQIDARRAEWQTFLNTGLDEWLTPYAVDLAEHPDTVTEVVQRLRDEGLQQVKDLAETVEEQAQDYRKTDDFEAMLTNETVLRHLIKTIGLPVPEAAHPFGRPPDTEAIRGNGTSPP